MAKVTVPAACSHAMVKPDRRTRRSQGSLRTSSDAASKLADPRISARAAGLRYSSDAQEGWTRRRAGRGFSYHDESGRVIHDRAARDRIKGLAIPPAWADVWICPWPNGHLQATGRDARGRKQYRYHARWRDRRAADKFDRMLAFAGALGHIRERCDRDLACRGMPRDKVLAAIVRLLELTLIRVGNDEYARLNRSFGLTTIRGRHATVDGESIRFRFRGKAGQQHEVGLRDRRLAAVVRRCQDLPGQELFAYVDGSGEVIDVASDDVNGYLREASGGDFTAKDFRTWAGTVLAYRALRDQARPEGGPAARRAVAGAVRETAERLGNTPAVARRSYVHPALVDAYLAGDIPPRTRQQANARRGTSSVAFDPEHGDEAALVSLLRRRLDEDARRAGRS